MGTLAGQDLGHDIRWTPNGKWFTSLGVPIGNKLDEAKWWGAKINTVRKIATQWLGLKRAKYLGRNLIVQGCYYGRLRYWLYSINMNKNTAEIVQRDANILWWSRDPTLEVMENQDGTAGKNMKRVRRWVAKNTAIGPREWGGLNNMDWADHVTAFKAQWFVRYLDPTQSAWKEIVDEFILKDKKGKVKYPEGRDIILQKLSVREKARILANFPKGCEYIKVCLREFWNLKIEPIGKEGIATQSPWHGHVWQSAAPNHVRAYAKHMLRITRFADFMNRETRRPFTRRDWIRFIERAERRKHGVDPDNLMVMRRADEIKQVQDGIPRQVWVALLRQYTIEPDELRTGNRIYLVKRGLTTPAIVGSAGEVHKVRIDQVGRGHLLQKQYDPTEFTIVKAQQWESKWGPPRGDSHAYDAEWVLPGDKRKEGKIGAPLHRLTINFITRYKACVRMVTPASETVWNQKLGYHNWEEAWRLKTLYATPRDRTAHLQLQHRTLTVAKHGPWHSTACAARGCREDENQEHLFTCARIQRHYWKHIYQFTEDLLIDHTPTATFWIVGLYNGKPLDKEAADIVAWAWRALYAAVVKAHSDETLMDFTKARLQFHQYTFSRAMAYCVKWQRWYRGQAMWMKPKIIPRKHQAKYMTTMDDEGNWAISSEVRNCYAAARKEYE